MCVVLDSGSIISLLLCVFVLFLVSMLAAFLVPDAMYKGSTSVSRRALYGCWRRFYNKLRRT